MVALTREQLFDHIGRKAIKLGMRWEKGRWPGYNHDTGAHYADNSDDLIHELGHWLVSPLRYRDKPYFGLGSPSSILLQGALTTTKRCNQLEEEASILGIVLYREFRAPLQLSIDMAREHNWDSGTRRHREAVLRRLERKGLWNERRQKTWDAVMRRI